MADPIPKPDGQRRRANKPAVSGERLQVAAAAAKPELGIEEPHSRTVAWWDAIWASPMAAVWVESDVHELLALADLKEMQHRGQATAAVLAEIRQMNDRYGFSPLARRRLQWEVDRAAPPGAPGEVVKVEESRWLRIAGSG